MRKIKRPMYFETDDYSELSDFYYSEIDKLNNYSTGMNTEYVEIRVEQITKRHNHDENILDYRQMHRKQWNKYLSKINPPPPDEKEENDPPKPEQPQEPVQCTAVQIINHDLLTSPTQVDTSADEPDEE